MDIPKIKVKPKLVCLVNGHAWSEKEGRAIWVRRRISNKKIAMYLTRDTWPECFYPFRCKQCKAFTWVSLDRGEPVDFQYRYSRGNQ